MFCKVKIKNNSYNSYYETYNDKNMQPLVILHGWGVDSSIFNNLIDKLNYFVVVIDFLGFGKSDKVITPLSLEDYVSQVNQVIKYLNLKNYYILGHSFGGRVAIKYNYYYDIRALILVDSAGIKHNSFKIKAKIFKYKIKKHIYKFFNKYKYITLINESGSSDYKILSGVMKQTMNKVIKVDLKKYCHSPTKTLILWGINDKETKVNDAYIFYNLFKNARLIQFYHSGHFPFLTEEKKFIRVVNEVLDD